MTTVDSLDHVGLMGGDLAALATQYERLGFALTALSQHSGALKPGDAPVTWGTGNRCAMLRASYLELLAVIDKARFANRLPEFLARYAGLHIIAFGCRDAAAEAARLRAAGVNVVGTLALERAVEVDGEPQVLRFMLVRLAPDVMQEGRILLIEHQTPELLWQPTVHPNGALDLAEVVIAVADVEEAAARYARLLGRPVEHEGAMRRIRLARGACTLVTPGRLGDVLPGAMAPAVPFIAGIRVAVRDIAAIGALLARNGVAAARADGQLVVPAREAGGATLVFSQ